VIDNLAFGFGTVGLLALAVFLVSWLSECHPWTLWALTVIAFLGFPAVWAFLRLSGIVG
jgi:hypothetical protein